SIPQPLGAAAYARIGTTFYVQGGGNYADNLQPSFWALDLSTSWTTQQPAWRSLASGPTNAYHTAGYSADGTQFITLGRDTAAPANVVPANWLNIYNIRSNSWTSSNPSGLAVNSRRDFSGATDVGRNKIYVVGGGSGNDGGTSNNVFNTYDIATGTLTEITTPSNGPQNPSSYSAVWIPRMASMLVIGGMTGGTYPSSIFVYNALDGQWSSQASSDRVPLSVLARSPIGSLYPC
ncbi:hypothetical protein BGW38_001544, partial [Lunasporangiospora selenospora]